MQKTGSGNSAIKVSGLLIHATSWMQLSERSQARKATYCMVPFIRNVQQWQIHTHGKYYTLVVARGLEEREIGNDCLKWV